MCDLSGLSEVKGIVHRAINELNGLASEKDERPSLPEKKAPALPNPRAAIEALDSELRKERGRLEGDMKKNLFMD